MVQPSKSEQGSAVEHLVELTRVREYLRRTASGKTVSVREHQDSRNAALRKLGITGHHNGGSNAKGSFTQAGGATQQAQSAQKSAEHYEKPSQALVKFYEKRIATEKDPKVKISLELRLKLLKKLLRKVINNPIPNIPGEHVVKHELGRHG